RYPPREAWISAGSTCRPIVWLARYRWSRASGLPRWTIWATSTISSANGYPGRSERRWPKPAPSSAPANSAPSRAGLAGAILGEVWEGAVTSAPSDCSAAHHARHRVAELPRIDGLPQVRLKACRQRPVGPVLVAVRRDGDGRDGASLGGA